MAHGLDLTRLPTGRTQDSRDTETKTEDTHLKDEAEKKEDKPVKNPRRGKLLSQLGPTPLLPALAMALPWGAIGGLRGRAAGE